MQFSNFWNRFLGSNKARISRRQFLGTSAAAGTMLGSDPLESGERRHFREREEESRPKPIPGGSGPFAPFGIFIHHFSPTVGLPLAVINEPSQITDFNGFVGNMRIRGGGVGTDTTTGATMDLAFQADIGFNQGRFVGADGRERTGTFGFVWLDLFTGPVGSANLTEQIHEYNPHIDSNDVFWTVPLERDAVNVDFDDAHVTLSVKGLKIFDDHDQANSFTSGLGLPGDPRFPFPRIAPVLPVRATVSFEAEWSGRLNAAVIENPKQGFKGSFLETGATINWSAEQDGFSFQSEQPNPARKLFAVIGQERNGVFFFD